MFHEKKKKNVHQSPFKSFFVPITGFMIKRVGICNIFFTVYKWSFYSIYIYVQGVSSHKDLTNVIIIILIFKYKDWRLCYKSYVIFFRVPKLFDKKNKIMQTSNVQEKLLHS